MRWWTHHYIELPRDFWTINHATAEVGSHRTRPERATATAGPVQHSDSVRQRSQWPFRS
jgi:hypothetical protein